MDLGKRLSPNWPLAALILLIAGVGVSFLVVEPSSTLGRTVSLLWGGIASAVAIWQYCYARVEGVRLWYMRTRMLLSNSEIRWGGEVEYEVGDAEVAFASASRLLCAMMTKPDTLLSNESNQLVAQISGITVKVSAQPLADFAPFGGAEVLRIDFPEAPQAYRAWRQAIDASVPSILESVESKLTPSRRKYVSRIRFPASNPYFGLFITHNPPAALTRVNLEYIERTAGENNVIRIGSDYMEIVSLSLQTVRRSSLHLMALQPMQNSS